MTKNPDYLIVYGTLRPPFSNPFAQFLRQRSRYVGDASFPGLLFDLGNYPGAIYQPNGDRNVSGTLYNIGHHKSSIFSYLDDYEGVNEAFNQSNEYIRIVIPVRCRDAVIDCWVYLYNQSTDGKLVIASGDYVCYSKNE